MAEDNTIRAMRDDYSQPVKRVGRDDPLAELARLIGQNEEFERLGEQRMRRADPPMTAPQSQAYSESPYSEPRAGANRYDYDDFGDETAYHAPEARANSGALDDPYAADPYAAASYAPQDYDERYAHPSQAGAAYDAYGYPVDQHGDVGQDGYYEQAGEAGGYDVNDPYATDPRFVADGHMPPHGDEVYQDAPAPKARSGLITVMAVLTLAVVSVGSVFAYRAFSKSTPSNPPVIKAEQGPTKLPASQSGKDDAQANKLIYDRVGEKAGGEKVVPREEQPVDVAKTTPRVVFPGGPTPLPSATEPMRQAAPLPSAAPETPVSAPTTPAVAPARPTAAPGEPKKVKTEVIRAGQSTQSEPTTARPPARVAQPSAETTGGPLEISPAAVANNRPQRIAAAPAATNTAASRSTGGGYMVQVAAQRSEADAQASFRNMQSKFPGSISGGAIVKRADLGAKGVYYRAGFGPFSSHADAVSACERLKGQGGSCLVQKI